MKNKIFLVFAVLFAICTACLFSACPPFEQFTKVIYHLNGGTCDGYYQEDADGNIFENVDEKITSLFSPISVRKDTWIFDGWYLDENLTVKFASLPIDSHNDVNLYAKWIDKIIITAENFESYFIVSSGWNGSMQAPYAAINYSFEPKYAIDPIRSVEEIYISVDSMNTSLSSDSNYTLSGSKSLPAGSTINLGIKISYILVGGPYEIYLLHQDLITVFLDLNEGQCSVDSLTVKGGDILKTDELPIPTKNGYRFMGWYFDSDFNTLCGAITVTRERTIFAKWAEEVKITFNTGDGSAKAPLMFLKGEQLQLGNNPTKAGFGFYAWYTDPEFTNIFDDTVAIESITLFARWIGENCVILTSSNFWQYFNFITDWHADESNIVVTYFKLDWRFAALSDYYALSDESDDEIIVKYNISLKASSTTIRSYTLEFKLLKSEGYALSGTENWTISTTYHISSLGTSCTYAEGFIDVQNR